jgi:hypothetical protein
MKTASLRWAAVLLLLIFALLIGACNDSERTWKAETRSPYGPFVATAETLEPGGGGLASPAETHVFLNWTSGSQDPTMIFCFDDGYNAAPLESGGMKVEMTWLSPTHLDVTYSGHRNITFQALQWQSIVISVRATAVSATGPIKSP